ncbi:MAG: hypothetical protein ACRERU_14665 [Methylococcales bacterium]
MIMTKRTPDPISDEPSRDELQKWFSEDTGCAATDGCWIATDGLCEHGHPSWLRYLGFVTPAGSGTANGNPHAVKLLSVNDVHGVYADAFVTDRSEHLLFGSFRGRDTSLQELLARLTLPVSEGGWSRLRLVDPDEPSRHREVSIGHAERLAKLTGRMPKSNLFGELAQVWLYDRQAAGPDLASRRALRICRSCAEDTNPERSALNSDPTWNLFKEVCHLPLLDAWRDRVVNAARQNGWVTFHPGVGVNALALNLGNDEFERAIEAMILDGSLTLPEKDRPTSNAAAVVPAEIR